MSVVLSRYPHLAPGLCGALACRRLCLRSQHCPAGERRARALLRERARNRFSVKLDRRRDQVCGEIRKASQCPTVCQGVGGCFIPQVGDHPSEARRKVFRAQRAMDALVRVRGGVS